MTRSMQRRLREFDRRWASEGGVEKRSPVSGDARRTTLRACDVPPVDSSPKPDIRDWVRGGGGLLRGASTSMGKFYGAVDLQLGSTCPPPNRFEGELRFGRRLRQAEPLLAPAPAILQHLKRALRPRFLRKCFAELHRF